MYSYTKDDILKMVGENDVRFIRLQFTDIFGMQKNVAITISQLEKALNNKCMFDGSSIEGFVRIEESDMYLRPDLNTFCMFPWRPSPNRVARLICDVCDTKGQPFEGSPRAILKNVIADCEKMGYSLNVGTELEFFLFRTDDEGGPTLKTLDDGGYFDMGPVDLGENARRDMVLTLEEMGFEIEASHHECARGQHEIDFKYSEAMETADRMVTFKLAVKTVAQRHGLHATFMPKPIFGIAGSGMHFNLSLSQGKKKRVCGRKRRERPFARSLSFYRRNHETHQGNDRDHESDRQFIQASGSRVRGAGVHRMVCPQQEPADPHSRGRRKHEPHRASQSPIRRRTRIFRSRLFWRRVLRASGINSRYLRPLTAISTK